MNNEDLKIDTYKEDGVNGIRIEHIPSGVTISSINNRSQHANKLDAMRKLRKCLITLGYINKHSSDVEYINDKNRIFDDVNRVSEVLKNVLEVIDSDKGLSLTQLSNFCEDVENIGLEMGDREEGIISDILRFYSKWG